MKASAVLVGMIAVVVSKKPAGPPVTVAPIQSK